ENPNVRHRPHRSPPGASEEPRNAPSAKPMSPPASPKHKTTATQSHTSLRAIEPGCLNTLYPTKAMPAKSPQTKPLRRIFCFHRDSRTRASRIFVFLVGASPHSRETHGRAHLMFCEGERIHSKNPEGIPDGKAA